MTRARTERTPRRSYGEHGESHGEHGESHGENHDKIQGFPNMPFVKCFSGFVEVPYQVPPWSLPVAPRMPKNKPKEAHLVPAPKARLYPKVLIAKCLPWGAEGPCQGQPLSPRKS